MIDAAQMTHLAQLARLHLTPQERETMAGDLNSILDYVQQLAAVDTDGVEEMQRPVALVNVLRDDEPGETLPQATVLALAPETQGGFVRVLRTVEVE